MVTESKSAARLSGSDETIRRKGKASRTRSPVRPKPVAGSRLQPASEILQRLSTRGGPALSDAELLALVVPGNRRKGTHDLARDLLETCGGVVGLLTCDFSIARAQGLDDAQAASVLAAIELGRRLVPAPQKADLLGDPGRVARYLHLRYARTNQEVLGALFLDVHQQVVGDVECFRGVLMRTVVEPRPILREALRRNAAGIVLFHNHPSGDPTPSNEDLAFTARMKEACEALNLELLDHLILGGARWTSIRWTKPHLVSPATS